ncbi:F-box protein [Criblamydia sequanensis]|uniref:F-box domain-containing protein n=1 Tax=Candidatus Criblamydia sequanensis CRIB-18 TaxID=1437425 RepID=A0A090D2V8_9BACT|nr:F-box protein [Criblamydia sequanensis]CDR34683.1 F-box domain-containing protein [Criblamydia sequanensis CRIB-18]
MASFAQFKSREYLSRVTYHGEIPSIKETPIAILGPETLLHVLSFLDGKSLTNAAKTCRKWQELSTDPSLSRIWDNYVLEQFKSPFSTGGTGDLFGLEPNWGFNLASLRNSFDLESILNEKPYTDLEKQIRSSNFTCISQFIKLPYENGSSFQASFSTDKLYFATKGCLYIFSDQLREKVCCAKLAEPLSSLLVCNDKVYMTFSNGYIRIYQEKDLKKIQSFKVSQEQSCFQRPVQDIFLAVNHGELLTTTKYDTNLKISNEASGRPITGIRISAFKEEVRSILSKNNYIYVRTRQNLQIWDRTALKIKDFIELPCASPINFLHVENGKIYVLHQETALSSLNLAAFKNSLRPREEFVVLEKNSEDIQKNPVFKIHNRSLYMAVGNNLKIFDLKTGAIVRVIKDVSTGSKITVIEIAGNSIFLGDMNGKLQKLEFVENTLEEQAPRETRKRKDAPV